MEWVRWEHLPINYFEMITKFTASNFEGNCEADSDFIPYLEKMNEIAIKHDMAVVITSSYRTSTLVKGAIVPPAKMSNHLIGFAIDCNLKDLTTGEYYNSKKMGDEDGLDWLFCEDVVNNSGLRWGRAFKTPDSIHFDYPMNLLHPETWHQKYNELQNVQAV